MARHKEREGPARLEQRIDGFHGPFVVGDVLEDIDAHGRVETVAAQRVGRLGQVMLADNDVGTIFEPVAGCANVVLHHIDPDDQLAIDHQAGDGSRAATDLENTLAQAVPDAVVDPAVVPPRAFHDLECGRAGCKVHVVSRQMNTPPSCCGAVPVNQVTKARMRCWLRIGPTIMA